MLPMILLLIFGAQEVPVARQVQERTGHAVNDETKPDDLKSPRLPPGISLDRPITPQDAAAIALWNNAAFHADLANLGIARADLAEARQLRNPNLSLLLPVGPKPFELALTAPIDAIWQRPRRIAAARINLEAVAHSLVQHGLDVSRDAKLAQIDLALAEQQNLIYKEAYDLKERIAELTSLRLRAGDIGEIESHLARSEAQAARDTALHVSDVIALARERLRMIMGLRGNSSELRAAPIPEASAAMPALGQLLEKAFAARPDLRASELSVQAAAKRAGWEQSRIVSLGLMLSSKEVGTYGIRSGPGLAVDLPIFNRNRGAIRRSQAEVERASWQYLATRDQIESEVRAASIQYRDAYESLKRLRDGLLPSLQRSVELTEKSYRHGDVSYLAVLESSRPLFDIRLKMAEATAALFRALAQLERSIGRNL